MTIRQADREPVIARVLVVEDDRPIGELLVELLEMEGYGVTWFNDAIALLDCLMTGGTAPLYASPMMLEPLAIQAPPDLILLDLQLPSMSGMDLVQQLEGIFVQIPPVILVSAQPRHVLDAAVAKLPGAQVLQKPFDVDMLLSYVAAVPPLR